MVSSNAGKRRGWRIALAALALGTVAAAGIASAPAKADEGWHRGWERHEGWRHDHDWDRHWHGWGWGWRQPRYYGYGYYAPPPVVYEPAPPPVVYAPQPYYGSLNVYIPLR
ncbi:MAG TPA: hypothetical protein VKZ79_04145 [Alphaproteobacteria bacterium]|nr:hypothetical protein [Alphaproteobacteria bacterium]